MRVLTITESLIPSSILDIIKPMLRLQQEGFLEFKMKYSKFYKEKDIINTDIVVLCRSISPRDLNIIKLVRKHNKKLVYDIDDNFFEISSASLIGRYHRHPMHLYVLETMLKQADAVRVYSNPMYEIAHKYNPNTYLLKSYFDFSLIEEKKRKETDVIKIVYATSRGKLDTLSAICIPAVARILEEFGDKVQFYCYGEVPSRLVEFPNAIALDYIPNYTKYIKNFYAHSFDIGLAPLLNDRFHNSKTNNKFREYAALGVCGIYSQAQIYSDCIINFQDGIIVNNTTDEWYNAIKELIVNTSLRKKIVENSLEKVRKEYSIDNTLNDWKTILNNLGDNTREYNNLHDLSIKAIVDTSFNYINLREKTFFNNTGFCSINCTIFDFRDVKKSDISPNDVVVCFISKMKDADLWLDELSLFDNKNIIVDTMLPYSDLDKYPNFIFTNPDDEKALNAFPIDFHLELDQVDIYSLISIKRLIYGDEKIDCLSQFNEFVDQVSNNIDVYYSLNNPQVSWARLLERYKGDGARRSNRLILFIKRRAKKFLSFVCQKVAQPIKNKIINSGNRMKRYFNYIKDYISINVFKKY